MFTRLSARLLLAAALLPVCLVLAAQSCPDKGVYADLNNFNAYGGITYSVVADADGRCGDAFLLQNPTQQAAPWDAGFQVLENAAPVDRQNTTYEITFRYRAASPRPVQFLLNSRRRGTYGDGGDHTYDAPVRRTDRR